MTPVLQPGHSTLAMFASRTAPHCCCSDRALPRTRLTLSSDPTLWYWCDYPIAAVSMSSPPNAHTNRRPHSLLAHTCCCPWLILCPNNATNTAPTKTPRCPWDPLRLLLLPLFIMTNNAPSLLVPSVPSCHYQPLHKPAAHHSHDSGFLKFSC